MSFSAEVKKELGRTFDNARHCRIAELAALIILEGNTVENNDGYEISLSAENLLTVSVFKELIKKLFHKELAITQNRSSRNMLSYDIVLTGETAEEAAKAVKLKKDKDDNLYIDSDMLLQKECCRRAFLRGAFLASGSISDPDRFYHFEIPCRSIETAKKLLNILNNFALNAKIVERHRYYVVYLKNSMQISELLGLMGARTGFLDMENAMIRREVRGNINRKVNCETANINKAAQAAARQIRDIRYIEESIGIASLPNGLDEMAQIRLKYPEATLGELGTYLEPPVGKSGVNHRLRKISNIATALKERRGECYD